MMIVSIVFLSACSKKAFQVGILIYDENDTFISELTDRLVERLPDGVNYEIAYASRSQFLQNQQLLDMLDNGFDLLIINLVDRLAASTIVEKCAIKGIPVVFINREPIESAFNDYEKAYYVGADPEQQGMEQANIAARIFGAPDHLNPRFDKNEDGKIQMVILKGEQGHQDSEKRTTNLLKQLQLLGYEFELIETRIANWERSTSKEVMEELDGRYGNWVEVIFANNDDMALGAIDYYLEEEIFIDHPNGDFIQPVVVIGVDGTQRGIEAIERGLLAGTVQNDVLSQSEAILQFIEYIKTQNPLSIELINQHYYFVPGEKIFHRSFT